MATATRNGKRSRRSRGNFEDIRIRGFARVQIGERQKDGSNKIVGDSGWGQNTLTTDTAGGLTSYIAANIGAVSGSKAPTFLSLATQSTAVNATHDSLAGDLTSTRLRKSLTATTVATGTLRMTTSWSSTNNTAATTIGSIAVYDTSSGGTMGSGQTFTTSQWASNQDVSATYEWRFS